MKRGFQIGTLFGIPFYLDTSWILVAVLLTFSYGMSFSQAGLFGGLILGLLSSTLVFGSVLAHELGHSLVAKRFGVEVESISLFLLGGMASFSKEPKTPAHSFWIASAGPGVSILLFGFFTLLAQGVPANSYAGMLIVLAQGINFALAAFNLLPGLPLDGGQMLKALVWGATKDFTKGVKIAAFGGQFIGWTMVGAGGLVLGMTGSFNGIWLAVLGWFIQSSARLNVRTQVINDRLDHLTVGDSLKTAGTVPANLPFSLYQQDYVQGDLAAQHLVLWQDEVIGVISAADGTNIQSQMWGYYQVRQLMTPLDSQLPSVQLSTPLSQVVEQFNQTPKLVVRGLEGNVIGVISPETIRRTLITSQS